MTDDVTIMTDWAYIRVVLRATVCKE